MQNRRLCVRFTLKYMIFRIFIEFPLLLKDCFPCSHSRRFRHEFRGVGPYSDFPLTAQDLLHLPNVFERTAPVVGGKSGLSQQSDGLDSVLRRAVQFQQIAHAHPAVERPVLPHCDGQRDAHVAHLLRDLESRISRVDGSAACGGDPAKVLLLATTVSWDTSGLWLDCRWILFSRRG